MKKRVHVPQEAHEPVEQLRGKVGSVADVLGFVNQKSVDSQKLDKALESFTSSCDMPVPAHFAGMQIRLVCATQVCGSEFEGMATQLKADNAAIREDEAPHLRKASLEDAFAFLFSGKEPVGGWAGGWLNGLLMIRLLSGWLGERCGRGCLGLGDSYQEVKEQSFSNAANLCRAIIKHQLLDDDDSMNHVQALLGALEPEALPDAESCDKTLKQIQDLARDANYDGFLKGPLSKVMSSLDVFSKGKAQSLQKGGDVHKVCETVSVCIDRFRMAINKGEPLSPSDLTVFSRSFLFIFDRIQNAEALSKEVGMVKRLVDAFDSAAAAAKANILDLLISDPAAEPAEKVPNVKKAFVEIYAPFARAIKSADCLQMLSRDLQVVFQAQLGELGKTMTTIEQV